METSNLKNTVILKSVPSNIIEEAIIVLKKNIKVKEYEIKNKSEKSEKGNYIIKEAEMIIKQLPDDGIIILLEEKGQKRDSVDFAHFLRATWHPRRSETLDIGLSPHSA